LVNIMARRIFLEYSVKHLKHIKASNSK